METLSTKVGRARYAPLLQVVLLALHIDISLSLYIYIYICIYVYIYICAYLSIYLSISLSLSIYIYIYIYITQSPPGRASRTHPRLLREAPARRERGPGPHPHPAPESALPHLRALMKWVKSEQQLPGTFQKKTEEVKAGYFVPAYTRNACAVGQGGRAVHCTAWHRIAWHDITSPRIVLQRISLCMVSSSSISIFPIAFIHVCYISLSCCGYVSSVTILPSGLLVVTEALWRPSHREPLFMVFEHLQA